jgi:hypothetical protein
MSDSARIALVRSSLDPFFNGLIAGGFLIGMYTLVLFQAIWKLWNKGNKQYYSCALVLLWISVVINFTGNWIISRSGFVVNNSSPISDFDSQVGFSNINMLPNVGLFVSTTVADAILIWRTALVWRNGYILTSLITVFVATVALNIWTLTFSSTVSVLVQALATWTTFMTTISASSLIALKILLVTRQSHSPYSYAKTIEVIIESAALVSVVFLLVAIFNVVSYVHPLDIGTASGRVLFQTSVYLLYLQVPFTGIAPTLITLRVGQDPSRTSLKSSKWTRSISG